MKSLLNLFAAALLLGLSQSATAQTNVIGNTGKVGIGTTSPDGILHVVDNTRTYFVNKTIPYATEDVQGINYLLLHESYVSGVMSTDRYVFGKLTGTRGGGGWNRKWTVEVNTSSSFQTNRGSIISYNEPARLVTLTYAGVSYLAVEIANNSTLSYFSFTGYSQFGDFRIVKDQDVSNIAAFQSYDPITMQGSMNIGPTSSYGALNAHSPTSLRVARFSQGTASPDNGFLDIANGTGGAGTFYSGIVGRSHMPGRPLGVFLQGEAEDVVPNTTDNRYGAVVLDGRTKTGAVLASANVLAVNSAGINYMLIKADGSVGIGTQVTHGNKLAVNGSILATKVKVKAATAWPDYVFEDGYQLRTLHEVEQYIQQHKHLPDVPSATEVHNNGIDLGDMDSKLLKKIEELMLYTIQQQKQIDTLLKDNQELKQEVKQLKAHTK